MNDLRFAFGQLLKNPAFSVVALLTLALGIGANTALFSLIDAVLLRPLPFPASDRIVWVAEPQANSTEGLSVAYPNFLDCRSQQTVFEHFACYVADNFVLQAQLFLGVSGRR